MFLARVDGHQMDILLLVPILSAIEKQVISVQAGLKNAHKPIVPVWCKLLILLTTDRYRFTRRSASCASSAPVYR